MQRTHRIYSLALVCTSLVFFTQTANGEDLSTEQSSITRDSEESYTPALNLLELGIYAGGLFPANDHNFQDERALHQELGGAPSLGARVGVFPLSYLGIEAEADISRSSVNAGGSALLGGVRAQLVAQLPRWRVTLFALAGVGRWFTRSNTLGDDNDPGIHFGVGAKLAINRTIGLRVDLRDNLAQATDSMSTEAAHHPQVLLSLSYTALSRSSKTATIQDQDQDGIADAEDQCPQTADGDDDGVLGADDQCPAAAGLSPHGCPDQDSDSILDRDDECPQILGLSPHGCPDSDSDGILDRDDKCIDAAGVAPHGCPDQDGDGIFGKDDSCPKRAENVNGFEDTDGCPDTKPMAVKRFEGVIDGITFRVGSAKISASSRRVLETAAGVLARYPNLRLRIHGHTDDTGQEEDNQQLSSQRAEAVRSHFVTTLGIDASRLESQGHGSDSPIATGSTAKDRAQNRRIEFEIIQ